MNVWLFRWDEPLPFDKNARLRRAGLLADKLNAHGHPVIWWTTNFNHFAKKQAIKVDEILNYSGQLTIVALKCLKYKSNTSVVRLISQAVIARHFQKMNRKFARPDLLIVHYPSVNLAYAAVRYAKKQGIPVIVDVRDMWPDTIVRIFPQPLRPLARLFLAGSFRMKKHIFQNADVLLAMSDYILEWATQSSGRTAAADDQVFYLGAPETVFVEESVRPNIRSWLEHNRHRFICAYVGTFGKSYNLMSVVQAAWKLQKAGRRDTVFILAGDGPDFAAVQAAAAGLDLVFLPGWINASESAEILRQSATALIPINDTTPGGVMCNKLFDYAAQGCPILLSVDGEMREFIQVHHMGLYFQDGQVDQLIAAINQLQADPVQRAEMAGNSRETFNNLLNADQIYEKYATLAEKIEKIAAGRQHRAGQALVK